MTNEEKAIQMTGRKPINPIGQCFESAIRQVLFESDAPDKLMLCHGIGIANMPGQEGNPMGHAWVEWYSPAKKTTVALDTTWGLAQSAKKYREGFKMSYVVEYNPNQAWNNWAKHDMPGPWDPKIRAVTDRKRE